MGLHKLQWVSGPTWTTLCLAPLGPMAGALCTVPLTTSLACAVVLVLLCSACALLRSVYACYTLGIRSALIGIRAAPLGIRLLYAQHTLSIRSAYACCTLDIRSAFAWHTLVVRSTYALPCSAVHQTLQRDRARSSGGAAGMWVGATALVCHKGWGCRCPLTC